MPQKPKEADVEDYIDVEEEESGSDPRQADTPFDPWGTEEEESDRRRDPLRNPAGREE